MTIRSGDVYNYRRRHAAVGFYGGWGKWPHPNLGLAPSKNIWSCMVGAKRSVLWPSKYSKMFSAAGSGSSRRSPKPSSWLGRGHPTLPHSAPRFSRAPQFGGGIAPKYFPLEPRLLPLWLLSPSLQVFHARDVIFQKHLASATRF